MIEFKIHNTNLIFKKALLQVWGTESYSYKNTTRQDYGFLYLSKGLITYRTNEYTIELKPGDIIYLPKGSNYEANFNAKNGKVENILINFDVVGNEKFSENETPVCVFCDKAQKLYEHFKNVLNEYNQKEKPLLASSYFYLCIDALQEATQTFNKENNTLPFRQIAKILSENNEISISELCNSIPISQSAFQKKFKVFFGLSPIEYRTSKRIERAQLLLETTDIPIKEIVDMLGYYDIAYFYKVFEKATSLTPKQYRNKNKPSF